MCHSTIPWAKTLVRRGVASMSWGKPSSSRGNIAHVSTKQSKLS